MIKNINYTVLDKTLIDHFQSSMDERIQPTWQFWTKWQGKESKHCLRKENYIDSMIENNKKTLLMNCCPLIEPGNRMIVCPLSLSRIKLSLLIFFIMSRCSLNEKIIIISRSYLDPEQNNWVYQEYKGRSLSPANSGFCFPEREKNEHKHPMLIWEKFLQTSQLFFSFLVDKWLIWKHCLFHGLPI